MAMWFVHLELVEASARQLDAELDHAQLAWGALCCDVDKVSRAERRVTHLRQLERPIAPRAFLDELGVPLARLHDARSFLAGVLSHLAVDDAWYTALWAELRRRPVHGFTDDTMRALNLALDMRARQRIDLRGLRPGAERPDTLLPFLTARRAAAMRAAVSFYLAWDGQIERIPTHPAFQSWARWFQDLLGRELPKLEPFLATLDERALMATVSEASTATMGRLLALDPDPRHL